MNRTHVHCFDCGCTVEVQDGRCAYCEGRMLGRAEKRVTSWTATAFECKECGAELSMDAVAPQHQYGVNECHCGSSKLRKV